jgi:hypothetical protein
MNHSDQDEEYRRLTELYAGMSDGELEALTRDTGSLTDAAARALAEERQRRSLPQEPQQNTATQEKADWEDLIVLRQFRDLPEALLAKGSLESAGIETVLADDNMVRMDWFISNLVGGIKLCVRPADADAAMELLNQPVPAGFEVEGIGEYQQPSCPHCGSLDISFEALNKPAAYASAWVGIPLPVPRRRWICNACGETWPEPKEQ